MPPRLSIRVIAVFLIAIVAPFCRAAEPSAKNVSDAQVRSAIERSLPTIEASGVEWMQNRKCISCHNVSFMLWSHNLAESRGIKIDQSKLTQWTGWTAGRSLALRGPTTNPAAPNDGGGLDTMAQLLLGRADAHDSSPPASWNQFAALTPAMIIDSQETDGHWKAAGQLPRQNRSVDESNIVTTRWAVLALASVSESPQWDPLESTCRHASLSIL